MKKSIQTEIETIESNNAAEATLWLIVLVMGAFSAYGLFILLWDVSQIAWAFTAAVFMAVSVATPMMVLRAEKGNGKWQVFAFVIAGLLALIDWGGGFNAGVQVENQVMKETWKAGQLAYEAEIAAIQIDLSTAKDNLQTAKDNRLLIVFPDLIDAGPQTTIAKTQAYNAQVKASDEMVNLAVGEVTGLQSKLDAMPDTYQKPKLINHTFLGILMAGLQIITLFGFVVVQRITRQRVEGIYSSDDEIEREIERRVKSRVSRRTKKGRNKKLETAPPKSQHVTPTGEVIYLTSRG